MFWKEYSPEIKEYFDGMRNISLFQTMFQKHLRKQKNGHVSKDNNKSIFSFQCNE